LVVIHSVIYLHDSCPIHCDSKEVAEENIVEQTKDNEDPAAKQIEVSGEGEQEEAGTDSLVI
jgi:hypothetical protein